MKSSSNTDLKYLNEAVTSFLQATEAMLDGNSEIDCLHGAIVGEMAVNELGNQLQTTNV